MASLLSPSAPLLAAGSDLPSAASSTARGDLTVTSFCGCARFGQQLGIVKQMVRGCPAFFAAAVAATPLPYAAAHNEKTEKQKEGAEDGFQRSQIAGQEQLAAEGNQCRAADAHKKSVADSRTQLLAGRPQQRRQRAQRKQSDVQYRGAVG